MIASLLEDDEALGSRQQRLYDDISESCGATPVPLADGRLLVLSYTSEGFVPAVIEPRVVKDASAIRFLGAELAEKHPVVTKWQVDLPRTVDDEKLVIRRGKYSAFEHIELQNAFPVLQGYKDSIGIGYHFNFADPTGFAALGVTAAYTPDSDLPGNERAHIEVKGRYLEWSGSLAWNRSDFYDLFGPTKRSRKGFAAKLDYEYFIIFDDPRKLEFVAHTAFYDRIDTLPYAQNVESGFDRLSEAEIGLKYSDVRRSLGAVDDQKGIKWAAHTGVQHVNWSWEHIRPLLQEAGIRGAAPIPPVEDIYDRHDPGFIDTPAWQACRRQAHRYLLDLQDPIGNFMKCVQNHFVD